jgi:peptide/nickel transport system permease protein
MHAVRSLIRIILRAVSGNWNLLIGLSVIMAILVVAVIVPWLFNLDPLQVSARNRLQGPSPEHWLGTDTFGRDLAARLMSGAVTSLLLAGQVTILTALLGAIVGIVAGYFPILDGLLMRICDGLLAIPAIMLAVALTSAFGPSVNNLVLALVIVFTPSIARVVRSRALAVKSETFVQASIAMGSSPVHVMWKHIFPNTLSVLVVQATYIFADTIIVEAALSFLGAGVPTPQPSWGNILYDGKTVITRSPHMVLFASAALILTVVALNIAGDGLRDAVDPKARKKRSHSLLGFGRHAEKEAVQ